MGRARNGAEVLVCHCDDIAGELELVCDPV